MHPPELKALWGGGALHLSACGLCDLTTRSSRCSSSPGGWIHCEKS